MAVIKNLGDDISHPMAAYTAQRTEMKLLDDLLAGTKAMQIAAGAYIPMEPGEHPDKYKARVGRTVLLEAYGRTIQKLTGEVFKEPINVSDEVPDDPKEWFKDIDKQGNDITVFFTERFEHSIHEGCNFWLVEYPPSPGKSLADHKKAGARPYLVKVNPKQIIGWRFTSTGNGPEVLTQLRIKEDHKVPEGLYGEKTVERIRLLTPGAWEVQEEIKGEWKIATDENGQEMKGTTSLNYIPLVCMFLGKKETEMTTKPPLMALGELNKTHWQSSSDQRNILHYARMMTWFGKGLKEDDDGNILLGANRVVNSDEEWGDLKTVEHSGAAIASGRQDLEDLKTEMALFGLSLMIGNSGSQTATETGINKGENDSALFTWVRVLNSALARTYEIMCDYVGIEAVGTIMANDDFSNWMRDEDAALLIQAFEAGLLPREIVVEELMLRGVITQEVDLTDLLAKLVADQQSETSLSALAGSFGAPPSESQGETVQ